MFIKFHREQNCRRRKKNENFHTCLDVIRRQRRQPMAIKCMELDLLEIGDTTHAQICGRKERESESEREINDAIESRHQMMR
jgi:hypothetical protein